ncbi:MAG TPA: NYN domain-containing protein [Chlamydiales bacterium]|nr:NYN domain-containing protein [Chlamydiales bacterium]
MSPQRVISFIDGFNLYHAISTLRRPELKWTDLRALSKVFLKSYSEELVGVYYFSAYAEHIAEAKQKCQRDYIKALELKAVKPILGHFKKKNRKCPSCDYQWIGHEEKETDVNIALFLLNLAYHNAFDRALVISNDSDLAPAIRMVRSEFPHKQITAIAPPQYHASHELVHAASDKSKIRVDHLERCLLPIVVSDITGLISVHRPEEYAPVTPAYSL